MQPEARKYLYDIQQAAMRGGFHWWKEKLAARLSGHRRIIAFRNILIHGYTDVDDRLVWDVVESKLPVLRHEVEMLLTEK